MFPRVAVIGLAAVVASAADAQERGQALVAPPPVRIVALPPPVQAVSPPPGMDGFRLFYDAECGTTDLPTVHNDHQPAQRGDRVLHRITLVGDVPVGVDGRSSQPLEGEPFLAA